MVSVKTANGEMRVDESLGLYPGCSAVESRFVDEYLIDFNATQAYRRAAYPEVAPKDVTESMRSVGVSFNRRPHVRQAIVQELEKRKQECRLEAGVVLHELMLLGTASFEAVHEAQKTGDFSRLTPEQWRLIESIEVDDTLGKEKTRVKLHSKVQALLALAKHLNLTPETLQGPGGVGLAVNVVFEDKK